MNDKIILKVQNLLELAYDAPNDEEGQSALLMAQKLMVKHNLAMSDIQKIHKNNIGETVAAWFGGKRNWLVFLVQTSGVKSLDKGKLMKELRK